MAGTEKFFKRTWAEIDLDALSNNFNIIRSQADSSAKIMAVVKADCYGHGTKYCLPVLERLGCGFFAVSNIEEALDVRKYSKKPLLILGFTPACYAKTLAKNDISQTVFSLDYAKELNDFAKKDGVCVKAHIKIDTGMQRIGFTYCDESTDSNAIDEILEASRLENLCFEGIFTHFAESDNKKPTDDFTDKQFSSFMQIISLLNQSGVSFKYRHCANSAGVLLHKDKHLDLVRAGIILYGLYPSVEMVGEFNLKPVMSLKSIVSMIKTVPAGTTIGYGRTFRTDKPIRVATVPVGYADGYNRRLSNCAYVLINGKKASVVGNVCMDQIMVDVSNITDISVGDEVLLFGASEQGCIPADYIANLADTIGYELVSNLGKRVPLVFKQKGKIEGVLDYYDL